VEGKPKQEVWESQEELTVDPLPSSASSTNGEESDGDDESEEDSSEEDGSDSSTDDSMDEEEEDYPYWRNPYIVWEARVAK